MRTATLIILAFVLLTLAACNDEPVKIACIGDSITAGYGLANQSETAYPVVLDSIMGEKYKVLNCGRSAATLQKNGNLPYWNCKEFFNVFTWEPDVVIIKLGTNDTKVKNWNSKNFENDYQALIDTLGSIQSKPEIIVCLPVPAYQIVWGINDSTLTAGVIPIIKNIATENHLQIIDLYKPLSKQPKNFPDGIHPNEIGTKKMAAVVAGELSKIER